jgi:hypothetical protein
MREEKEVRGKPSGNGQNYNEPVIMEIFARPSLTVTHAVLLFNGKKVVMGGGGGGGLNGARCRT